jgi:gluconate 5-dehydrogenase
MLNLFDLHGQVAIVTGASKGLGESFAHALAASGADLFLMARRPEGLIRVAEEIRAQHGVRCEWCTADIGAQEEIRRAVDTCMERYGRIDILVNNAAAMRNNKPPQDTTPEEFDAVMHPNVIGTFMMAREVGAVMRRQKSGRIVNISSMSALIVNRGVYGGSYEVSKAAVSMLTKTLAVEWAQGRHQRERHLPGLLRDPAQPGVFRGGPHLRAKGDRHDPHAPPGRTGGAVGRAAAAVLPRRQLHAGRHTAGGRRLHPLVNPLLRDHTQKGNAHESF